MPEGESQLTIIDGLRFHLPEWAVRVARASGKSYAEIIPEALAEWAEKREQRTEEDWKSDRARKATIDRTAGSDGPDDDDYDPR